MGSNVTGRAWSLDRGRGGGENKFPIYRLVHAEQGDVVLCPSSVTESQDEIREHQGTKVRYPEFSTGKLGCPAVRVKRILGPRLRLIRVIKTYGSYEVHTEKNGCHGVLK